MFKLLILLISLAAHCEVKAVVNRCPPTCSCSSMVAKCKGLNTLSALSFPADIINITITNSYIGLLDATSFGNNVGSIYISETNVSEIASFTFSNLPFVREIHFVGTVIKTIKSFAFSQISTPASIAFVDSGIGTIETQAFRNLKNLLELRIKYSTINTIKPYAFFTIQARNISVVDSDIKVLMTMAYTDIYDTNHFEMVTVTMSVLKSGAFSKLSNISHVKVHQCRFAELQCNAIMELRESTPGNHQTFIFSNSTLVCDCSVIPMLKYARTHSYSISESVKCTPSTLIRGHISLRSIEQISDICPTGDAPICEVHIPYLPTEETISTLSTTVQPSSTKTNGPNSAKNETTASNVHKEGAFRDENKSSRTATSNLFILTFVVAIWSILDQS